MAEHGVTIIRSSRAGVMSKMGSGAMIGDTGILLGFRLDRLEDDIR